MIENQGKNAKCLVAFLYGFFLSDTEACKLVIYL